MRPMIIILILSSTALSAPNYQTRYPNYNHKKFVQQLPDSKECEKIYRHALWYCDMLRWTEADWDLIDQAALIAEYWRVAWDIQWEIPKSEKVNWDEERWYPSRLAGVERLQLLIGKLQFSAGTIPYPELYGIYRED